MLQTKLSQTLRGRIGVGLIRHQYANGRFQVAVLQFRRHSLGQKLGRIPRLAPERPLLFWCLVGAGIGGEVSNTLPGVRSHIVLTTASLWSNQNDSTPMKNRLPVCEIPGVTDNRIQEATQVTGAGRPGGLGDMLYNPAINRSQ